LRRSSSSRRASKENAHTLKSTGGRLDTADALVSVAGPAQGLARTWWWAAAASTSRTAPSRTSVPDLQAVREDRFLAAREQVHERSVEGRYRGRVDLAHVVTQDRQGTRRTQELLAEPDERFSRAQIARRRASRRSGSGLEGAMRAQVLLTRADLARGTAATALDHELAKGHRNGGLRHR
jgi:hypothetical protein